MLKKLTPYLRRYRIPAILCPIIMILEVGADVLMPRLMARIVDEGIANQDIGLIARYGGQMVGLAFLALILGILGSFLGSRASMGFGAELRFGLFSKVQSFSFANLDKLGIPSLITRLTSDITQMQHATMMSLRMLFRAPFMIVLALIMAITINRRLAVVFLIAIPILAIVLGLIMSRAHPRFRKLQKQVDQLNSTVQENLIGIRVVKAFDRSDYEKERFREANTSLMQSAIRAVGLVILNMPIMSLVLYGCIIAIIWFGGGMVRAGAMLTGELISFIAYVTQILMSTMMLSMIFIMLTRAKASGDRVVEILDMPVDIVSPAGSEFEVDNGSIEFRGVDFLYPDGGAQDVLSDISLRIESGERVGIIGATGSAKTSLVQLIPRLYDATAGEILVGGRDIREYDLQMLRDAVAMVLQNNTLFTGTIRENLQWGNPEADDAELLRVCRIAQAEEFVLATSDGLDTKLGQGGVNLSGGQKQRLCIARALLKKPRILILDDSTSAIDTSTDAKLRQAMAAELQGTTVLIIAQRIASIQDADQIVVLDSGRMNGVGKHEDLMESNEIYRDVYLAQMEGVLAR